MYTLLDTWEEVEDVGGIGVRGGREGSNDNKCPQVVRQKVRQYKAGTGKIIMVYFPSTYMCVGDVEFRLVYLNPGKTMK